MDKAVEGDGPGEGAAGGGERGRIAKESRGWGDREGREDGWRAQERGMRGVSRVGKGEQRGLDTGRVQAGQESKHGGKGNGGRVDPGKGCWEPELGA